MGGMDWAALETVAEIIGADDIEKLVIRLVAIRDWQNANKD